MAKYSIEDTTLTALGDAVRGKTGELTRQVIVSDELWEIELAVLAAKFYQFPEGTRKVVIKIVQGGSKFNHYHTQANGTNNSIYISNKEYVIENVTSTREGFYVANYGGSSTLTAKYQITCYADDVKNTLTPMQMAETIEGMAPPPKEEAYLITGNCDYRFQKNGWNWFVEQYGDKVITEDITTCANMFNGSDTLTKIPFDINISPATNSITYLANMFLDCNKLTNIPKINFTTPLDTASGTSKGAVKLTSAFELCENIKEIDYDIFNNMFTEKYAEEVLACSGIHNARNSLFDCCKRLRKHPDLSRVMTGATGSNNMYSFLFYSCYCLDEIVNLPVHPSNTTTSNMFSGTFEDCERLKRMTFATQADGTPYTRTWKNQTIDISFSIGYGIYLLSYYQSHGSETEIDDDASYQVNKNNEDSWTSNIEYSRYNHDSAVETINTLPDVSAGSGNTIKFKGVAGSKTDGGAINTMTEEEIAVATAKGWTVSFV